jgi:diguanylate cyclase (GGDEF)-like protein
MMIRARYLLVYDQKGCVHDIDFDYLKKNGIKVIHSLDKKETVDIIRKYNVGVVLTTYNSPKKDSISFLRYIMKQYPHTQRIYLSNRVGKTLFELIVNKAHINYFLALPVKKEKLLEIVIKANKRYEEVNRPYKKLDEFANITAELIGDIEKYKGEAETDPLTGIYNRRSMDSIIENSWNTFKERNIYFSFVIIDIDNFKELNDLYGHQAGDQVLRVVGQILKTKLRKSDDSVFRYGGDEFAIIATNATSDQCKHSMDRILNEIRATYISYDKYQIHFTFSAGVEQIGEPLSIDDLIKRTDAALYYAKRNGRNQVVIFQDEMQDIMNDNL